MSCFNSSEQLPEGLPGQSITSPDGVTRAFVWIPTLSGGLGATTSQPYQIWIENTRFAGTVLVAEAYKTDGFRLSWTSEDLLEVCYADARIYKFVSGVDFATEHSRKSKTVEVVLRRVRSLDECNGRA
jgi:hypothetical protein